MYLDYLTDINEFDENVVRLYGFEQPEAVQFKELIEKWLLSGAKSLDLSKVEFIEPRNCTVAFIMTDEDEGMVSADNTQFYCCLTKAGFEKMVELLAPYCSRDTSGYQWLYDIDNPTDFLFSPAGTFEKEEDGNT